MGWGKWRVNSLGLGKEPTLGCCELGYATSGYASFGEFTHWLLACQDGCSSWSWWSVYLGVVLTVMCGCSFCCFCYSKDVRTLRRWCGLQALKCLSKSHWPWHTLTDWRKGLFFFVLPSYSPPVFPKHPGTFSGNMDR